METIPKDLAELDTCASLYLREIGEPAQNSLRLIIEEAFVTPEEVTVKFAETEIANCHLVKPTPNSRLFEIVWDNYVAYSVANESYSTRNESEEFCGRFARLYAKSYFLDYVSRATLATVEYPGPMNHIQVVCECHIIDVVSTKFPRVGQLRVHPAKSSDPRESVAKKFVRHS
jgi:hypothetical protein